MKSPLRLFAALFLALACAAPAFAQESDSKASQPWMKLEKELGLQTTYSVDMVMQAMGMNMTSRTVRDGGKTRTEMSMPFMNLKMVALEIPQGGQSVSYTLFPDKKKYVRNEETDNDGISSAMPKIEELGTETYEGEACIKRRVTLTEQGISTDMIMLFSPKQKNMPVKMTVTANASMGEGQPSMPIQSVVLFKNYDFSTPNAAQFALPADYVQAASLQAVMMEGLDLGAMMQQMQQMMPTEE
jgi:hypothetical protein